MSKIISVHYKKAPKTNIEQKLVLICKKLEPDNIKANEPLVKAQNNDFLGIMNPVGAVQIERNSILLGQIRSIGKPWHEPNTPIPEGSYGLFRNSETLSEVVTDASASRTIWYYFDDNVFISATSQRAIVLFMGSFEFNEKAIPWILSTGSLGPRISWDKRIKQLPPDSSIVLDKKKWTINLKKKQIEFKELKKSFSEHQEALHSSIKSTFENFNIDVDKWVLPLSGGYDSRGILYSMRGGKLPKTITWGLSESQTVRGNDAYVAKKIATKLGALHKYYTTDLSSDPIDIIVERFIRLGEGRIDHIGGYMDGFKIWQTLFEDNVEGIIRGDEGFGWSSVSSELNVRLFTGSALCKDYINLNKLVQKFGLPEQEVPHYMLQKEEESLDAWRDRLYHEFRLPTVLSALTDLKLSYVEQTTPLLNHNILYTVRGLPDKLRTEKKLFKKIIDSLKPKIEYASVGANARQRDILRSKEIGNLLRKGLMSEYAFTLFPEEFLKSVVANIKIEAVVSSKERSRLKQSIKKLIPTFFKNYWYSRPNAVLDNNLLAFRVYMIIYIHELFSMEHQASTEK